nr:unnamed protein product [Digitaria exilis]
MHRNLLASSGKFPESQGLNGKDPLLDSPVASFGGQHGPPSFAFSLRWMLDRMRSNFGGQRQGEEPTANRGSKSPPRNDIGNEELDQRHQNKPRRYSEMNFSQ